MAKEKRAQAIKANPVKTSRSKSRLAIQTIEALKLQFEESVRKLSKSRKRFWQQIPYLCLQAQWKSAFIPQYEKAYRTGYWQIGTCNVMVDCATGELLYSEKLYGQSHFLPAFPRDLWVIVLEELDAKKILKSLQAECEQPDTMILSKKATSKMLRKDEQKLCKVKKIFERK